MVEEALSLLGGVTSFVKPGGLVVMKPNVGHAAPPETSINTNPEIIAALVRLFRKADPGGIILAEASAVGQDTLRAFEVSGIAKAAREAGVDRIVDIKRLSEEDLVEVKVPSPREIPSFRLPRFLLEADCVVGVPIFKTHFSMVFTAAVKGMKGTVDDRTHRRMHFVNLGEALFDLLAVAPLHLSVVDMIRPQEGLGPMASGRPVEFGAIVAGSDPVAVDATCCRIVGISPEQTYLRHGPKRGMGVLEEALIEIRGRKVEEVFKKLDTSFLETEGFSRYPGYEIHGENACSSCIGMVVFTLEQLKLKGKYKEHKGLSMVFGPKRSLPRKGAQGKNLILVGNCVKRFFGEGVSVWGCPPMGPSILSAILTRENQGEEAVPIDTWKERRGE